MLDGLLDPIEDFSLLAFAIHQPTTCAVLTRSAILNAQIPTFPESPAPRSPTLLNIPPSLTKLSSSPQLSKSLDIQQSLAKRHIATGRATLILPHLQLPWGPSLIETVWTTLHVRVVVPEPPESMDLSDFFAAVIDYSNNLHLPLNNTHHVAIDKVYHLLSKQHQAYNSVILSHLRRTYKPQILHQIGLYVRLNFANSILNAIRNHHEKAIAALRAPSRCSPLWMSMPSKTNNYYDLPGSDSSNAVQTETTKQSIFPGVITSNRPLLTSGATALRSSRLGAAETGFVGTPSRKTSSSSARSRMQSTTSSSSSTSTSSGSSRSTVTVKAHRISDGHVQSRDSPYLVHGVVVPGSLLEAVSRMLSTRFGINILIPSNATPPPHASLAALSMRGLGTGCDFPSSLSHSESSRSLSRVVEGRGPVIVDDDVDLYLTDTFGLSWPKVCSAAVRDARIAADQERKKILTDTESKIKKIAQRAEVFRDELIKKAVSLEVAGAKLGRICAFALAQQSLLPELEEQLKMFSKEYAEEYFIAKRWIKKLEDVETKPSKMILGSINMASQ